MDWVKQLYDETKKSWKENEEDAKGGFAIFYSPVKINPTIALIGYNPGGDEKDFNEQNISIPLQHEYFTENYKIAEQIKKIPNGMTMVVEKAKGKIGDSEADL